MNLKLLACVLSLAVVSFPLQADTPTTPSPEKPIPQVVKPAINLNTADVKTLSKSVKGIGAKRAEAIIKYREAHQGFKSVAELANVPGIGKTFEVKHHDELEKVFSVK